MHHRFESIDHRGFPQRARSRFRPRAGGGGALALLIAAAVAAAGASAAPAQKTAPAAAAAPAQPAPASAAGGASGFTHIRTLDRIEEYRLDSNGLTVLLVPDHSAPVVTFQV